MLVCTVLIICIIVDCVLFANCLIGYFILYFDVVRFLRLGTSVDSMQKRSNEDDHDHESSKRTRYSEELTIRPDVSSQISLTSEKGKRTSNLSAPTIQLDGHSGAVYSVAFDSTGQNLASASFDRQICE